MIAENLFFFCPVGRNPLGHVRGWKEDPGGPPDQDKHMKDERPFVNYPNSRMPCLLALSSVLR